MYHRKWSTNQVMTLENNHSKNMNYKQFCSQSSKNKPYVLKAFLKQVYSS